MDDDATPRCPNCSQPMLLIGIRPRAGDVPELGSYACRRCRITYSERRDQELPEGERA